MHSRMTKHGQEMFFDQLECVKAEGKLRLNRERLKHTRSCGQYQHVSVMEGLWQALLLCNPDEHPKVSKISMMNITAGKLNDLMCFFCHLPIIHFRGDTRPLALYAPFLFERLKQRKSPDIWHKVDDQCSLNASA